MRVRSLLFIAKLKLDQTNVHAGISKTKRG